ncbi:hypothetical protein NE452_17650 [Paeniclostridium sordellii]|uniref:hypothetical protein n=1 Tax=Paraclostridium sordellii TaxID=1505 RepID=UPI00210CF2A6|nr:hypothetical protein [Paeniclostridium sordellii]MCQ4699242.1 hypothetical protein [Paeniclostridium sordellii]
MENLKGEIIRENEDDIVIHLNHICKSGKIFYKDNLDSKDICLMDFINTDIIKFKDHVYNFSISIHIKVPPNKFQKNML